MIDYSQSKIFIVQYESKFIIKATTMTIARAKAHFKIACAMDTVKNEKLKNLLAMSNFNLHLLKVVSCKNKRQLNREIKRCKKEYIESRRIKPSLVLSLTD